MSLIQVSSQSRSELDNNEKQDGFRFSNRFNGVLEVPPYSEIAVHSGQMKIDSGEGIVLSSVGSSSSNDRPVIRMNFQGADDTYATDVLKNDNEYPSNATSNPFVCNLPKGSYVDLASCWKDIGEYLKLDPRPQFQTNYSTSGGQTTGLVVETIINNSKFSPTFTMTTNEVGEDETIDASVFNTEVEGTDAITQSIGGNVLKTAGTSGRGVTPSLFYTNSNGIHNANGYLSVDGFLNKDQATTNNANQMLIGIKRWGSTGNSKGWADMYDASLGLESFNDAFFNEYAETIYTPYAMMRNMFVSSGYSLPQESTCEFAFHITKKVSNIALEDMTAENPPRFTFNMEQDVCNILKYEKGRMTADGYDRPRCIMIATGDMKVSEIYDIPYSKELDPTSDLEEWTAVGNKILKSSLTDQEGAGTSKIILNGNVVTFEFNAVAVTIQDSAGVVSDVELTDQLSDVVFPLQVFGVITRGGSNRESGFIGVKYSVCGEQTPVLNYGREYTNVQAYKANKQMIPAEIYNYEFASITPKCYYPLDNTTLLSESSGATPDTMSGDDIVEQLPFIYFGSTTLGNAKGSKAIPNVDTLFGSPESLDMTTTDEYLTFSANYTSTSLENPFLKGIYIRLKNLTNRSTFGSLNAVDTDKLIAVINRYDSTNQVSGLTDFPLYSFTEYDRLYIALNNPSALFLSQLDFEIVDRAGDLIREIDNTTLVLHLRPAQYRDLYGYKREEKAEN